MIYSIFRVVLKVCKTTANRPTWTLSDDLPQTFHYRYYRPTIRFTTRFKLGAGHSAGGQVALGGLVARGAGRLGEGVVVVVTDQRPCSKDRTHKGNK